MSAKRLTRPMVERTVWIIDESNVMDVLAPPTPAGQRGRKGRIRENTRLWVIGVILCTRLGHETTVKGVYDVLTQALPREMQWELGVLRPLTTTKATTRPAARPRGGAPDQERQAAQGDLDRRGLRAPGLRRPRQRRQQAARPPRLRARVRTEPRHPRSGSSRRSLVEDAVDRLITVSVIPRPCSTVAIDGTGQWSWNIGPKKEQRNAQKRLADGTTHAVSEDVETALQVTSIVADDDTAHRRPRAPRRRRSATAWTPPGATRPARAARRRSATASTSTPSCGPPTRTPPAGRSRCSSRDWSSCPPTRTSSTPPCGSWTASSSAPRSPGSPGTCSTPTSRPTGGPFPWPSAASSRSSPCARTATAASTSTAPSCSTAGCTAPPPRWTSGPSLRPSPGTRTRSTTTRSRSSRPTGPSTARSPGSDATRPRSGSAPPWPDGSAAGRAARTT